MSGTVIITAIICITILGLSLINRYDKGEKINKD